MCEWGWLFFGSPTPQRAPHQVWPSWTDRRNAYIACSRLCLPRVTSLLATKTVEISNRKALLSCASISNVERMTCAITCAYIMCRHLRWRRCHDIAYRPFMKSPHKLQKRKGGAYICIVKGPLCPGAAKGRQEQAKQQGCGACIDKISCVTWGGAL